jgi:hypothetical protein
METELVSVPSDTLNELLNLYAGIIDASRSGIGYSPITATAMMRLTNKLQEMPDHKFQIKIHAQA